MKLFTTYLISLIKSQWDFPEEGSKCYKGGDFENVCDGLDACPPCWIRHFNFDKWACYDKIDGECEPWKGMVDVTQDCSFNDKFHEKQMSTPDEPEGILGGCPDPEKDECMHGGQTKAPKCKGMDCPPCWVQKKPGVWGCFKKLEDGKCPFEKYSFDIKAPNKGCDKTKGGDSNKVKTETFEMNMDKGKDLSSEGISLPDDKKPKDGIDEKPSTREMPDSNESKDKVPEKAATATATANIGGPLSEEDIEAIAKATGASKDEVKEMAKKMAGGGAPGAAAGGTPKY